MAWTLSPAVFSSTGRSAGGTPSIRSTAPERNAATRAASLAMKRIVTVSKAGFGPQ